MQADHADLEFLCEINEDGDREFTKVSSSMWMEVQEVSAFPKLLGMLMQELVGLKFQLAISECQPCHDQQADFAGRCHVHATHALTLLSGHPAEECQRDLWRAGLCSPIHSVQ